MFKKGRISSLVVALLAVVIIILNAYLDNAEKTPTRNDSQQASQQASQQQASDKSDDASKPYRQALYFLWSEVYALGGNTLYCDAPFTTDNREKRAKHINAEHVFPASWIAKDLQCGTRKQCQQTSALFRTLESDLHNIYPALVDANKSRSNYRFGNVNRKSSPVKGCTFYVDESARIAEPREAVRGDIARAMLYMAHEHGLTLYSKNRALMLDWHRQDPPDQAEINRAKQIEKIQGRDNPFITQYPFVSK